jgi:hypothetical protein
MRRLASLLPLALFLAMPTVVPASVMVAPPLG